MFRPVFNYILHPEDDQEGIPFVGGGFQACKTITNHSDTFLITRSVIFAVLFGPFGLRAQYIKVFRLFKSCRSRLELCKEYVVAEVVVDTAENESPKFEGWATVARPPDAIGHSRGTSA